MRTYLATLSAVKLSTDAGQPPLLALRFLWPYQPAPEKAILGLECDENDRGHLLTVANLIARAAGKEHYAHVESEPVRLVISHGRLIQIEFRRTNSTVDFELLFRHVPQI